MPEQTATGEAVLILRPRVLRLVGGPQAEKRGGTWWGTQSESAAQKKHQKHEPGHMPVAVPAMLEGYVSTRPPRTEQ